MPHAAVSLTNPDADFVPSTTEYTVQKVLYPHSPSGYVLAVTPVGAQQPALIIAQSAALLRLKEPLVQLGLYAARRMKQFEAIGDYTGALLGTFPTASAAARSSAATRAERRGSDKLLVASAPGKGGFQLIDGSCGCAPYLGLVNDCLGTRLPPNVYTEGRRFSVLAKSGVRGFDFSKPLEDNAKSELLWSYGSGYWEK